MGKFRNFEFSLEKSSQNERSSALWSLKVNKVSRFFSRFSSKFRILIFCRKTRKNIVKMQVLLCEAFWMIFNHSECSIVLYRRFCKGRMRGLHLSMPRLPVTHCLAVPSLTSWLISHNVIELLTKKEGFQKRLTCLFVEQLRRFLLVIFDVKMSIFAILKIEQKCLIFYGKRR